MNPLSAIEICNTALIYVGSGYSIDSFEDEDPAGRACRLQYPQSRREFLDNDHPFSFATTRTPLAAITGEEGWYQLPSDMIKPICLSDDGRTPYYIEKNRLFTTAINPTLIYIQDSIDLNWFPQKAVSAVQFILAAKLTIVLKNDLQMAKQLQDMAVVLIQEVAKSDIKNLQLLDPIEFTSALMESR